MRSEASISSTKTEPSSKREAFFILAGVTALLVVQWNHFMSGYRLTADDVMFYWYYIEGWDKVWQNASEMAAFSGRIGHYLMTPLNAVGAYLAGDPVLRGLMVLGHFGLMLVFCVYVARLLIQENRKMVVLLLFLILLSLHPLAYSHMPPNAYPLQNTLPFLMILGGRLLLLRKNGLPPISSTGIYLLLALAMLVSEYALLFATALMAAEHALILKSPAGAGKKRILGKWTVNTPRLAADAAVAFGVLALYLGYRWFNPSEYVGNQPDGFSDPGQVLYTAFAHVFAGTTVPYLDIRSLTHAELPVLLGACAVGLITFACSRRLIAHLPSRATVPITGIFLLTLTLMLYMALPLAITEKAQDWCLNGSSCGYLDSRASFLGFAILGFCIATLLKQMPIRFQKVTPVMVFSVCLGILAGATHLHNHKTAEGMAEKMVPWEHAERLACNDQLANVNNASIWRLVDSEKRVSFHPWLDRGAFWRDHMKEIESEIDCSNRQGSGLLEKLPSHLRFPVSFADGKADRFLDSGWSYAESWGVWSDGAESTLSFKVTANEASRLEAVALYFHLFFGPSVSEQRINVSVNDDHVDTWVFEKNQGSANCCRRVIPMPTNLNDGKVTITFKYESTRDPSVKGESSDPRALALGIEEMEWLKERKL